MKFLPPRRLNAVAIAGLCSIIFACALALYLSAGLNGPAAPVYGGEQNSAAALTARLDVEEQMLQERREQLSALLRAYYMGQATEKETAKLIEEVEQARLRVADLSAELERARVEP